MSGVEITAKSLLSNNSLKELINYNCFPLINYNCFPEKVTERIYMYY